MLLAPESESATMSSAPDPSTGTNRLRVVLDVVTSAALIAASLAIVYFVLNGRTIPHFEAQPKAAAIPTDPVSLDGAMLKGNRDAGVAVIVFSDFECPYCGQFARDTWPRLDMDWITTGKVVFAFRHLPLEEIHHSAMSAAEAAECAGRQGKFWEMHDLLFENQRSLENAALVNRARNLNIDVGVFSKCLAGPAEAKVRRDGDIAKELQVQGTPVFLVGVVQSDRRVKVTKRLEGAVPLATLAAAMNEAAATLKKQ